MIPLVGIGAIVGIALLLEEACAEKPQRSYREKPERNRKKKIFICFAIEDERYRNFLVQQAKDDKSPFTFIDMSVKEPWSEKIWKRECRKRIRGCDGFIALLSNNTWHSAGSRWEMKCAEEEGVKMIGMHIRKNDQRAIPPEMDGKRIITWSWKNIKKFIDRIK